jgi:phosphoserine aminotransferase
MSERKDFNFSAGPSALPVEVLGEMQAELQDLHGTGTSVLEMSHRSDAFEEIAHTAGQDLRDLLAIPEDYRVLFLQGGATGQFAAVPLNLADRNQVADYVVTGIWGKKAAKEASKFLGSVNIAAETNPHIYVPQQGEWRLSDGAAYVHVTTNETINGVRFATIPNITAPIVADKSSDILSEPIDVTDYGVIYAGAQKNIGPAGLTVVIAQDELLERAAQDVPAVWDWKAQSEADSMLNTPPTASWYVAGLVFKWLKRQGGVEAIAEVNQRKAQKLYAAIDGSELYSNPVAVENRSRMNIPFILGRTGLEAAFLEEARTEGLTNLEGHRSVGGLRASIYNAMPEAGVDTLVSFMKDFEGRQ